MNVANPWLILTAGIVLGAGLTVAMTILIIWLHERYG